MSATPGPWRVGEPTDYVNQIAIEPAIGCAYGAGEEVEANARQMAASPELRAQLRRVYDAFAGETFDWEPVRAALAKAGKSA